MSHSHDELREALGAYVLGQLDDEMAIELKTHLATCDDCRSELADLSPVAHALREMSAHRSGSAGGTPAPLDQRINHMLSVDERRPRRWPPAAVGALVGVAATIAVATVIPGDPAPPGPVIVAVPGVTSTAGVVASAGLVDHTWGVEIKLTVDGLPAGRHYDMRIIGDDGTVYQAGEFVGVRATTIHCNMSASVLLEDAASFTVLDPDGKTVVAGSLPS